MTTSRITNHRMAEYTPTDTRTRGTSTAQKAIDFASDLSAQKAQANSPQPSTPTASRVPNPNPANVVASRSQSAPAPAATTTPTSTESTATTPAASSTSASQNQVPPGITYVITPFNQFAGQPYTPAPASAAAPSPAEFTASPNAGKTTNSGAPDIKLAQEPIANAWNYTGPAAKNPYFMTTGTAPDTSTVKGYANWFANVTVYSGISNGVDHSVNPMHSATLEGAQEALRLVQMYEPNAQLESVRMGEGSGPYLADGPTYSVVLPDGSRMNAGAILNSYYHGGAGVSAESDMALSAEVNANKAIVS
jgi:hypothetical protein